MTIILLIINISDCLTLKLSFFLIVCLSQYTTSPLKRCVFSCAPNTGGSAADQGEARTEPGGPEEAGGDQRMLAGSGEHHSGQSPPAFRGQQGGPAGSELREPGPETGPAGGSAGLRRPGTRPHHCQQTAQETTSTWTFPG